jgi:hypothetical protein
MNGRDVRREQGQPDHGPAQGPAGEKVILAPGPPPKSQTGQAARGNNAKEIEDDNRQVDPPDLDCRDNTFHKMFSPYLPKR